MIRKVLVISALSFLTLNVAEAGFSSRGGSSSFSSPSRSYSAPSRGYSSPSYSAPSRSFSTPAYKAPSRSFTTPAYKPPTTPYRNPSYNRSPTSVYRSPVVVHHYYNNYPVYGGGGWGGGGVMSNPFFWMWAMDRPQTYYQPGVAMPNGVATGGYYQEPVPVATTIISWLVVLVLLGLFIWFLAWLWRRYDTEVYYD